MLRVQIRQDFDTEVKIPENGPVLLACGPHANQLIDSLVVLKSIPRIDIGFLTAQKTMRSKYFGKMARILRSIPVERPQDKSRAGRGKASVRGTSLKGHHGAMFTKEMMCGDTIMIFMEDGKTKLTARVKEIVDDTTAVLKAPPAVHNPKGELRVVNENIPRSPSLINLLSASKDSSPVSFDIPQPRPYKIVPKIDQSKVFSRVITTLEKGKIVGIFPEGGSHDNPHLLPLKAGITIMALETMSRNPELKVPIIPIGINYFNGHRFRSRVYVETGEPIVPSDELLAQYRRGGEYKRAACVALLAQVRMGMQDVTIETPDRSSFEFIQTVRRLYTHKNKDLDAKERHAVTKAFADKFSQIRDEPRVQTLRRKVEAYRRALRDMGLTDSKVADADEKKNDLLQRTVVVGLLTYRSVLLLIYILAAIPALILAAPIAITTRMISSRKARQAAARSSVKLSGRDVIATWKLLVALVMIPLIHIVYTVIAASAFGEKVGVVYFFFAPFISLAGVRCFENSLRVRMSIMTLFLTFVNSRRAAHLVKIRSELQREVRILAQKYGWDRQLAITQPQLFRTFLPRERADSASSQSSIPRNESYGNLF